MNSTTALDANFIYVIISSIPVFRTNLVLTSISGFLVFYSFLYYYLNSNHKLKFNNLLICIYSCVFSTHSIVTFVFRSKMLKNVSDSSFLLILWLTGCLMVCLSFILFLEQRKNFYKRTALVNNTPTFIVSLEKCLMCLVVVSEISRYIYVVTDITSVYPKDPCYIGSSKHFAFLYIIWQIVMKIAVTLLMLQPVLTFWSRLKVSSARRFSLFVRIQVFKPIICSFFWVISGMVYTLPYLIGRLSNYPCEVNLELFYILAQFVHMSNLIVLILAIQARIPNFAVKYFKRYKKKFQEN